MKTEVKPCSIASAVVLYRKRRQRMRSRLIAWICSGYEFRNCAPMLQGYRRKLEEFSGDDLWGIRNFLLSCGFTWKEYLRHPTMKSVTDFIPEAFMDPSKLGEVIAFLKAAPLTGDEKVHALVVWSRNVGSKTNASQRAAVAASGIDQV